MSGNTISALEKIARIIYVNGLVEKWYNEFSSGFGPEIFQSPYDGFDIGGMPALTQFDYEKAEAASYHLTGEMGFNPGREPNEIVTTGQYDNLKISRRYGNGTIRTTAVALIEGSRTNSQARFAVDNFLKDVRGVVKQAAHHHAITMITGAEERIFRIANTNGVASQTTVNGVTTAVINLDQTSDRRFIQNAAVLRPNTPIELRAVATDDKVTNAGGNVIRGNISAILSETQISIRLNDNALFDTPLTAYNDAHYFAFTRRSEQADAVVGMYGLYDFVNDHTANFRGGTAQFPYMTSLGEVGVDPNVIGMWRSTLIDGSNYSTVSAALDDLARRLFNFAGVEDEFASHVAVTSLEVAQAYVRETDARVRWAPDDTKNTRPTGYEMQFLNLRVKPHQCMPKGTIYVIDPTALACDNYYKKGPMWFNPTVAGLGFDAGSSLPILTNISSMGQNVYEAILQTAGNRLCTSRRRLGVITNIDTTP